MLLDAVHGDCRHGITLRPPSWPSLDPPLPRFSPVPSVIRTVAPSPCTELAVVLSPSAMAEPPTEALFRPPPSFSLPQIYFWPFISNPTATVGRYPFAGSFAKEPL